MIPSLLRSSIEMQVKPILKHSRSTETTMKLLSHNLNKSSISKSARETSSKIMQATEYLTSLLMDMASTLATIMMH